MMRLATNVPWHFTREQSLQWATSEIKKTIRLFGYELKSTNFHEEDESALIEGIDGEPYVIVDLAVGGSSVNVSGWPGHLAPPMIGRAQ